MAKYMRLGDLLDALAESELAWSAKGGTKDEWRALELVVRGADNVDDNDFCGAPTSATLEGECGGGDKQFFVIDATNEAET